MHKQIGNKQIDITDLEFKYYNDLVKSFSDKNTDGKLYFEDLFEANDGLITLVKTDKSVPWAILFFTQQIMINQRLRANDANSIIIDNLMKRIENLEAVIVKIVGNK